MKKLVKLALAVAIVIAMLVGGWTCVSQSAPPAPTPTAPSPAPTNTLYIGIATPLTGPAAFFGTIIKNAVQMAVDAQNEQGGVTIGGQKYNLATIVTDTKFDTAIGKNVAAELVYDKKVNILCGPFADDAVGVQTVTEPNKVISFFVMQVPGLIGPDKPHTFFCSPPAEDPVHVPLVYLSKFYPEAKTVLSMGPDLSDTPLWENAAKRVCPMYGLNWLGMEKFPYDTKDFMPVISRALAKNPDVIETSNTAATMGGMSTFLVKQLREAGFKGFISMTCTPPVGLMETTVPKESLAKVVTNDVDPDSPIVSKAYHDLYYKYKEKYGEPPTIFFHLFYNDVKAFFEFLNGQDSMDTTAWAEGFGNYRWQGVFGFENHWFGEKVPGWGINRCTLGPCWPGEYVDGKLETKWQGPPAYEMFE